MTAVEVDRVSDAYAPLTVDGIHQQIAPVLARLAASATQREAARDFAFADVAELAAAGIGLAGIARHEGGAGGSLRDVADLVITLARADSSLAQALRSTFLLANQVASRADLPHREAVLARLQGRALFAGTSNERSGGAGGEVRTRAERVDGGWVITGEKYYSTGGLYAQWFSGQAVDIDGRIVRFTVPTDREGVELVDDFDAVGQRLTASGTTRLRGVLVHDSEVVVDGEAPANPYPGSFAQLYLAAVQAGIAARALDDARAFVLERARPIKHSSATRSSEDPYVRQSIGEIAARARAARSVVLLAAEEVQAGRGLSGAAARSAGAAAAVAVAEAGVVAIESALRASELLFDTGGGSITDRSLGFDRHWRNARTAANHNPRQWKQAVAGAYHLTGEEPPHHRPVLTTRSQETTMTLDAHRVLGRTGALVSPLTLGTMNFGRWQSEDESVRIIHAALDAGITSVDTADVYAQGASEEILATALAGRRDDVFLATKFHGQIGEDPRHAGNSRAWITRAVEDSLRRLGTDHLDLYQAHRPDPRTDLLETLQTLNDLIRAGKIRYYGTSVFPAHQLVEAQWLAEKHGLIGPHTEQLPYSLLVRSAEREVFPVVQKYGVGVLSYGPLAAGWLSGKYRVGADQPDSARAELIPGRFDVSAERNRHKLVAADALARLAQDNGLDLIELSVAFALNHPAISSIIIGPRTAEHLETYLKAAHVVLDDAVLDRIDEIVAPGTHFLERDTGRDTPSLQPDALRR